MYFITCLNEVWRRNARRMRGILPLERGADGRVNYEPGENTRCFGYFPTIEEAESAVRENLGDIHECWYTLCVIEKLQPGIHPMGWLEDESFPRPMWFEWTGSSENGSWQPIECPEEAKGIVNFALG
jgi:hypothetical protein